MTDDSRDDGQLEADEHVWADDETRETLPIDDYDIDGARELAVDALIESAEGLVDFGDHVDYEGLFDDVDEEPAGPAVRDLVLGDDDPRDALLAEKIFSEDVAWKGRFFNVDRLRVELPNGKPAIRDVVRHPGAVAVVALTDEGQICLVRQYRTSLGRVTVEIPAGKLTPGEDPLECARRELEEETGMQAKNIAYLTTIATSSGFADELIHIYMATGLSFGVPDPDDDEFINVDLVDLSQLIDAVLDGRIEDAKTVVGALACDAIARRLDVE